MTSYDEPTGTTAVVEEAAPQVEAVSEIEKQAQAEGAPVVNPNSLLEPTPLEEKKTTPEVSSIEKPAEWPEELWDRDKGIPKYQDTLTRLSTAEKRAEDMRKKLSTKDDKPAEVTEEYKFENLPEGLASDSKELEVFSSAAKHAGLSNEQAGKLVSEYYRATAEDVDARRVAETELLGPDGKVMLEGLGMFGKSRLNNRTFSEEEHLVFQEMVSSARSARVMAKIVEMTGEQALPASTRAMSDAPSVEDLKLEMVAALGLQDRTQKEVALRAARSRMEQYYPG